VLTGEGLGLVGRHGSEGIFPRDRVVGPCGVRKLSAKPTPGGSVCAGSRRSQSPLVNGCASAAATGRCSRATSPSVPMMRSFGLSEINWGILPGGGATKVAVELMPWRKAMYHALLGENLTGRQAEAAGLVKRIRAAGQLESRVTRWQQAVEEKLGNAQGHQGCDAPRREMTNDRCRGITSSARRKRSTGTTSPMAGTKACDKFSMKRPTSRSCEGMTRSRPSVPSVTTVSTPSRPTRQRSRRRSPSCASRRMRVKCGPDPTRGFWSEFRSACDVLFREPRI